MTAALPETVRGPTRDAIFDVAERQFADHGFAGVSVREIAGAVGLRNQASLYHYFPNKRALYEAVLRRRVEELTSLWGDAHLPEQGNGGRATRAGWDIDRVFDYLVDHPHVARLIERAGLDDDPFVRGSAYRLLGPLYTGGLKALGGITERWGRDELPHVAAAFYHMIFGYFANAGLLRAVLGDEPLSLPMLARQRRFLRTAIAQLLDAGPTEETPRLHARSRTASERRQP